MRFCIGHSQGQLQQHAAGDERPEHLHGVHTQLFLHRTHGFFDRIFRHSPVFSEILYRDVAEDQHANLSGLQHRQLREKLRE